MSGIIVDGVKLEDGEKISVFLVASSMEELAKECERTPLCAGELMVEKESGFFRRALVVGASNPKDNGIFFIPWDAVKNERAIAYQEANPALNGVYKIN